MPSRATAPASDHRVLCIAPAWNEGTRIGTVVRAVPRAVVDEVLVVDDGSSDMTAQCARDAGATVLCHGGNRGVGAAIRTGFEYARAHDFDIVVVVSGGGKTPPAEIPRLLAPIREGRADFVQGSRYVSGGRWSGMPRHRRLGTRLYSGLFSILAGRRVSDGSSGFRALKCSVLEDRRIALGETWLERYELEPYLLFKALRLGYRVAEVPVTIAYPSAAYTKMRPLHGWWSILRPILMLAFGLKG